MSQPRFDERGFPVGHHDVHQVKVTKEPIAQVDDETVNIRRRAGVSEDGLPVFEKMPTKYSIKMLDRDGNELWVALHNHRVRLQSSMEKYGRPHLAGRVREGWLPKDVCPLTKRYESITGGALASPIKGEPTKECEVPANSASDPSWHGCVHYIRIRDRRRKAAEDDMQARKKRVKSPTDKQIEETQKQNRQLMAKMTEVIEAGRSNMRKGISEAT